MKYYTDDITWCSNRKCNTIRCERNPKRRMRTMCKEYSVADFEGTEYCIKRKPKAVKNNGNL